MALSKSVFGEALTPILSRLLPASAALALAVSPGCSGRNEPAGGALPRGAVTADKTPAAYWTADRIEDGVAVLENMETLRTEEFPVKGLPSGVNEGSVLTDDGIAGGALRVDDGETAARAARISERFRRLKGE
jgi:hypothetical protein